LDTFRWGSTIAGATILLVLLAHVSLRSAFQSLAYSAVCGLALMLALRPIVANVATASELQIWFAAIWILGTVLFSFIDRSRVAAAWAAQGVVLPVVSTVPLDRGLGLLAPEPARPAAATSFATAAPAVAAEPVAPAPPPPPPVATAPAPPPPPPVAPSRKPLWASGATNPAPAAQSVSSPVFAAAQPVARPAAPPPVAPQPAPPPPPVPAAEPQPLAPLHPGAEVITIYVDMTSGGYSCLRGVQAEHLTRDIYRILEPMPHGEDWKFMPGQVVRCKKEKLSTGKAMVAVEEVHLQQVS
jgi:hypothetical protein